ncbi:MAG: SCO family protein [Methylocystis sp.]
MANGTNKAKGPTGRAAKQSTKGPVTKGPVKQAPARVAKPAAKPAGKAPTLGAKPLIGIGVAAALLFGAFVVFTNQQAAPPAIGGPFQLTTQFEKSFTDKDMLGRPYLVFFGYTNCPDICHTTLFELSEILRALGPDAKVGGMFVTVDPERDTPRILKDYLSSFDSRIVGLTGAHEALDPMLKEFRIFAKRAPGEDANYGVDHTTVVYLMDKNGHFVNSFNVARKPADAARELQRYM